ncbi:MAG: hypothetical protein LBV12_07065 [Puniceicoccales bacterium]|jgi:hypothetical protein|nr:hypothetical protein [Puniceicoccales bacterium]
MSITLNVTKGLSPDLQKCYRLLKNRKPLMTMLGGATAIALRRHFRRRNREPNKSGFPKANWWQKEVAQRTALTGADNNSATVTIASAQFPLKFYGGTVKAKRAKYLAIPMHPAAYGKTPRDGTIQGLWLVNGKNPGKKFLARHEGGKLVFYFSLVKSATHRPDPRALPDLEKLTAELVAKTESYLEEKLR